MNKLTGFEISKALRNKSLYICILISALLTIANNSMILILAHLFGGTANGSAVESMQNFTGNGMVGLMLAVMVPLVASEDHANETLKNIFAKGFSRKDVYLSKFIASMVAVVVFCLADIIVGGITGGVLYGFGTMPKNMGLFMICNILCLLGLASVYFMIALIAGKAGISVAVCVAGPQVVSMVLSMASTLISTKLNLDYFDLSDYWISYIPDAAAEISNSSTTLLKCVGIAAIYVVVSIIAGIFFSRHKEL